MEIEISINEILTLKKESFSKIVKQKVREKALETLNSSKEKHSKMKHLEYEELKIKKYLKENVNKADELFRFRTRMVKLRGNKPQCRYGLTVCKCPISIQTINYRYMFKSNKKKFLQKCLYGLPQGVCQVWSL